MAVKYIITFLIAMVPVIELRGAIPYGTASGLSLQAAALVSILGNMVPVPLIILFIRKIIAVLSRWGWFKTKLDRLVKRAHLKGRIVTKYKLLGLILLVAIPLPGTGAWTGALAAAFLDIRLKNAVPGIFIGVIIAAAIVSAITLGAVQIL